MYAREIEKLFADEKTIDLVLEDIRENLEVVDKWTDVNSSDFGDNKEEIKKAIDQLSKAYKNIRLVAGIADSEYRSRDDRYYNEKKIQAEADGVKFTDATTKKEASLAVAEYRRIRNITEAYSDACNKRITVLQSILKDIASEHNSSQE